MSLQGKIFVHRNSGIPMALVGRPLLPTEPGYDGGAPGVSFQHFHWTRSGKRVPERESWFFICDSWEALRRGFAKQGWIPQEEYTPPIDPAKLENVDGMGI